MSALSRKLLRDLWGIKSQAAAIALVIGAGVAMFVMALSALESLTQSKEMYYERYRYADVFAQLKRAPDALKARIAEIPGVARIQTRIVVDVTLDVEDMAEPAVGRLISVPEGRRPLLNDLHIRRGRYIEPDRAGEVLVSESFADAHNLAPSDTVNAVINGRWQELKIVGIALSPEYIIQIPAGNLLPDDRRFGVFWIGRRQLEAAYNMEGAFNNVSLSLMRGASEPEVIKRLDDLTEQYGAIGAAGRDDQVSHRYISDEIQQLRGMGMIAPSISLAVAAFLLNVVISRVIGVQREQIAALKAFGYTKWEVGLHYLLMVLSITVVGCFLGIAGGAWLSGVVTELYAHFYRFPAHVVGLDLRVVFLALLVSNTAAVLGTVAAVGRAVRLPPAEAMRPEPPAVYRPTFIERSGLGYWLPHAARMTLRQLERRPLKAALTCLGIAMAVSVLILGAFGEDSLHYIMDFQFVLAQRQDVTITFVEPTSAGAIHDVEHLPGVMRCEPFRSVATRLRFGHRSRRVGVMGLAPGGSLFRLLDAQERVVPLPNEGLMLSDKLAELLGVGIGDAVTVEVLEGERPVRLAPVTRIITEFSGTNAYMNIDALRRLLREGRSLSGAFLAVDGRRLGELYSELKMTPRVAGVTIKTAALRSFEETFAENILQMRAFNIMFACVIAFGVVYNSARISLSERSRELATLRVMGFTRAEISAILLGEFAVLALAAIPLGLTLGYGLAALVTLGLDTEMYRIPLVVNNRTYAFAATVTLIATLLSSLVVRRRLDRLDLVGVMKTRE